MLLLRLPKLNYFSLFSSSTTIMLTQPCQCATDLALEQHGAQIRIIDAQKQMSDKSNTSAFIVYTIRFQDKETKRRYSDFDSFRNGLAKLYPDVLVPPIPEKHSLTDYAHVPNRNKDNQAMVDKRKRMLQRFLIRLASHPRLCHEHVFHRFLDSGVPWAEVLNSPPLSILDNEDGSFLLPSSTSTHILKDPDLKFTESETIAEKHAEFASSPLDRSQRRLMRRLGDLANDYAELGTAYKMLGKNENEDVAPGVEKIGSAADTTYSKTQHLVHELEVDFAEHMQEYAQYTRIAKQVLRQRHLKHAQLELIGSTLQSKKSLLRNLLQTEDKALQLEADMNYLSPSPPSHKATSTVTQQHQQQRQHRKTTDMDSEDEQEDVEDDFDTRSIEDGFAAIDATHIPKDSSDETSNTYPTNASASAIRASRDRYRKWSSPRKLLNAMSYTIQGMMDVDPEATRRNQIAKLRENVAQLENAQSKARQDLKEMSENIQQELDMFEKQRTHELRAMMIAYAKIHIKYCEESVASWKDARRYVDTIQP
ncbi:hypothetical protein BDA99DRAFT_516806 [Phascolomyces articulosus]|uniref:PX domain-containing protein n=1 Tax=Phascolomyces articulosus TaxID=60185 RepID=A0AAD5K569_9FUNG|nr:hypothetical protein BDA99DRAFT_516806 [Phascolomyces articulosus]